MFVHAPFAWLRGNERSNCSWEPDARSQRETRDCKTMLHTESPTARHLVAHDKGSQPDSNNQARPRAEARSQHLDGTGGM
jgi:hypothetical protein